MPRRNPDLTRDDVIAAITHAARDVVHAGGSDASVATLDAALKAADAEGYGHSARALAAAIVEELEDAPAAAAPATVESTPGKKDFYTLDFFWGKVVPGSAKRAKDAGGLIQVYFTEYGWGSRDDKSQPRTKSLFALVDASGNVTEGPAFDAAFRKASANRWVDHNGEIALSFSVYWRKAKPPETEPQWFSNLTAQKGAKKQMHSFEETVLLTVPQYVALMTTEAESKLTLKMIMDRIAELAKGDEAWLVYVNVYLGRFVRKKGYAMATEPEGPRVLKGSYWIGKSGNESNGMKFGPCKGLWWDSADYGKGKNYELALK